MALEELIRELRSIADRLEKEARSRPAPEPARPPAAEPPAPPATRIPEHIRPESPVPTGSVESGRLDSSVPPLAWASMPAPESPLEPIQVAPIAKPTPPPAPPRPKPVVPTRRVQPDDGLSLEQRVGAKWFAAAGAVVITAGVAFFTKLAWDAGWIQQVPPGVRCLIGAGFGGFLLVCGELARARVNRFAGGGLSTAGVGSLYASAYSAHIMGVVGAPVAFVLMAASAAVGLGVALRTRLVGVAAFSLLGGYLVPVLLASPDAHPAVLPVYLLALLAVGLVLSAWQGGRFSLLRPLVLTMTVLLGMLWTIDRGADTPVLALCFYSAAWLMAHAELLVAAWREDRSGPGAIPWPPAVSLSTTVFAVGFGLFVCDRAGFALWSGPAAWTAALVGVWSLAGGRLRSLRERPTTGMGRLRAFAAVQAASLLALTIALAFAGEAQVAAWFALGVAGVVAGRWIASRGVALYGLALFGVGTARLIVLDGVLGTLGEPMLHAGGLVLTPWLALMLVGALAWMVGAFAVDDKKLVPVLAGPVAWVSLGTACLAWFHVDSALGSYTLVWGAIALGGALVARFRPRWHVEGAVVLVLTLAAMAWGVYYTQGWLGDTSAIGFSTGMLVAAALAALAWGAARLMPGGFDYEGERFPLRSILYGAIAVLIFASTSLEAARAGAMITDDLAAQRALVSIWWGIFGVGLLVCGWRTRMPVARYAGLGLIAIATGKAVVFDLISVDRVWRVASFIGLGLMMLGVATAYARWIGPKLEAVSRTKP